MTNPTNEDERLDARVWKREPHPDCPEGEWVLEIKGTINDTAFVSCHTEPLTTAKEDVPGLPSLYAAKDDEGMAERMQAATVERLQAENARLRQYIADQANSFNIVGSAWHQVQEALDRLVTETKQGARAALSSRESSHG